MFLRFQKTFQIKVFFFRGEVQRLKQLLHSSKSQGAETSNKLDSLKADFRNLQEQTDAQRSFNDQQQLTHAKELEAADSEVAKLLHDLQESKSFTRQRVRELGETLRVIQRLTLRRKRCDW